MVMGDVLVCLVLESGQEAELPTILNAQVAQATDKT